MHKINEWDSVFPRTTRPSDRRTGADPAGAIAMPVSVAAIQDGLMSLKPQPPDAVHFYLGEGLRWIRVGFDRNEPIKPAAVAHVGRIIASCLPRSEPLFFHALRPRDMLFFLENGEKDSTGMAPEAYGTPLDEVLHAWGIKGHSISEAPYSQRSNAKP
jgi:hypothetical protein